MGRRRWWLLAVFLLGWLLLGSTCETVRETQIVSFEITPNPVVAGGSVFVAWQAEYVGLQDGGPYCTLQRSFEGGPAEALEVVPCIGWRTDEIGAATEAQYVNYRFSALRRTGQSYETEVVQVAITHVDVGVTVLPESVTLAPGGSQVFTATVSGASDSSVTWAATCGSISGSGSTVTYTAPASVGTCEVTVASVADPDTSVTASVTVEGGVSVALEPSSVTLEVGGSQQFVATVVGASDASVSWSSTCGSVSGSGSTITYAAPSVVPSDGTCTITVTSLADTSASASATAAITTGPGEVLWTRQFGTNGVDRASGVAVDGSGNVVVVGVTFGSIEGVSAGIADAFVRKYDAAGNVLWTRQFGTNYITSAYGVAVDGSGNVVVVGYAEESLDGEGVYAGGTDAFVRKYDAAGNALWTRQFRIHDFGHATAVAVDGLGNVVVIGEAVEWSQYAGAGIVHAFVRKYDAAGNTLWTREFGTLDGVHARGVAVDGLGNVVVIGDTFGSLEGVNAGGADAFVRKYDASGSVVWTRQFGTSSDDRAWGVAADESGNVVVAGDTFGSLEGTSAGSYDAFVRKYDAAGSVLWTRQFGTSDSDAANGVAVDGSGNVLVVGETGGSLESVYAGGLDAFVRKYEAEGDEIWTRQFGTNGVDRASGVAVDGSGNVLVVGETNGSLEGVSAGDRDAFVRKYAP